MAASRRDSTPPPPPTRPLPVHLSQIAHIVRLICDARLPLHLGRKNFSHPDDGGLRLSSVRLFPEVESDVTAYMLHFRSPLYICIGKAASKLSPTIQPFVTHTGQKDPPPVRWPSTESDDQPYDMNLLELWCIKFVPHSSSNRSLQLPPHPSPVCCLGRTLGAMLRLMPLFCSNARGELMYLLSSTIPHTTVPHALKDSYDFGGPVDTEGGKLSVSVQFTRPATRVSARSSQSVSPASLVSSSANASGQIQSATRPPTHPSDTRDPKISPPVAMLPPRRNSISPGSAPDTAPISSAQVAPRRNSLQPNPSPVGSLEAAGSFGGGSRIFSPPVTVRVAGSGQPVSSATVVRAPSVASNQHPDNAPQTTAAAAVSTTAPSPSQYILASSMNMNASSVGSSSSFPAMSAGLDLLHAHTPRLAIHELGPGGSVSRTSSAGSLGGRELQPLSLAWEGGGASSAKVTSSASQVGDNMFMLADSSDDDGNAGPSRLEEDDGGLSDSAFRFGAFSLKLASANGEARCSMQEVVEFVTEPKGNLDLQLQECEALFKDLQYAAH